MDELGHWHNCKCNLCELVRSKKRIKELETAAKETVYLHQHGTAQALQTAVDRMAALLPGRGDD